MRTRMVAKSRAILSLCDFDGVDVGKMCGETFPDPALIATAPHFTARAAEVNACGIIRVGRHRLPLDGEPGLRPWQPGCVALPGFAAIDRTIHGRLASRRYPRPNAGSVHREYP